MGSVTGTTLTRSTLSYSFIQPSNNNPENLIHSENVEVGEQKDENEHSHIDLRDCDISLLIRFFFSLKARSIVARYICWIRRRGIKKMFAGIFE